MGMGMGMLQPHCVIGDRSEKARTTKPTKPRDTEALEMGTTNRSKRVKNGAYYSESHQKATTRNRRECEKRSESAHATLMTPQGMHMATAEVATPVTGEPGCFGFGGSGRNSVQSKGFPREAQLPTHEWQGHPCAQAITLATKMGWLQWPSLKPPSQDIFSTSVS